MRQNSNEVWRGKIWGSSEAYIVPAFFVLISAAFAVNTLLERPDQALPGLGLLGLGVGVFYWVKRGRG